MMLTDLGCNIQNYRAQKKIEGIDLEVKPEFLIHL
jgi:hypothetical protein